MSFGSQVRFDALKEVPFSSIGVGYQVLGGKVTNPCRQVVFNNALDQAVYISFDGVTDNLRLQSNSVKLFDFTSNKAKDNGWFLDKGTQIWIKQVSAASSVGDFWVELVYGKGSR